MHIIPTNRRRGFRVLLLGSLLIAAAAAWAASGPAAAPARSAPAKSGASTGPGVELARNVSLITGVAISPLLGVGAVGAYDFITTPKERRAEMNWYANPLFWVPALLLVAVVFFKDVGGTVVPPGLKKPLDVAEVVENKVSGLVAAGAFVPVTMGLTQLLSGGGSGAGLDPGLAAAGFAAIDWSGLLNALLTPFAVIAFAMVWLVSHAINVLILLSPFPIVDAALKAARTFLLSLVTATSFVNPYVGCAVAVAIILLSWLMAGWAFRLMVLGSVFSWDFLTRRRKRFLPTVNANWMFLVCETEDVPVRTYGRLVRSEDGRLSFEYRPWLVLERRKLELPAGRYWIGRCLFFPEIHVQRPDSDAAINLFDLPPRYRGHEEELARAYAMPVQDMGLLGGLKAAWRWLRTLFGGAPEPTPAPAGR